MIFYQHFYELKFRIFYVCIHFLSCWSVFYLYKYELLYLLQFKKSYFIFTHVSEVFASLLKISIFMSVLFTLPYFILQIWSFLCSSLYEHEHKKLLKLMKHTILFIIFGNIFFFKILFPWSWEFFSEFGTTPQTHSVVIFFENRLQDYLNFFVQFFFLFNFSIISFVLLLKIVQAFELLTTFRKPIYLGSMILSAFITPPDVVSQLILGLPMIFSYECLIFCNYLKKQYLSR